MFDDDSEKEKHKEIFKRVAKALRENPRNYLEKLAELGFTWVDDEVDEEDVEGRAVAEKSGFYLPDTGVIKQGYRCHSSDQIN